MVSTNTGIGNPSKSTAEKGKTYISVWVLGRLCGMEDTLIVSVEPKSITTPIAVELSKVSGGVVGITAVSVTLCGMLGASLGPTILNLFKIKNPIARGSAIGCASHGIGTSRALEESAVEGAISGLCIALMGVATSVLMPIFNELIRDLNIASIGGGL